MCLLFPIWGTPTWLARDPGSCAYGGDNVCSKLVFQSFPGSNSLPKSLDDWKAFITALVTRYSVQQRAIYAYEIWNEPTNAMFLNSTGYTDSDWMFLAEMAATAYTIIKALTENLPETACLHSTDPSLIGTYVLAPSLIFDGNAHMAAKAADVLQGFVNYRASIKSTSWFFDAMTCHVYDTNVYDASNLSQVPVAAETWGLLLDQCCKLLGTTGMPHPDQPWLTELGFSVNKPQPPYDGQFAYQLVQATYAEVQKENQRRKEKKKKTRERERKKK